MHCHASAALTPKRRAQVFEAVEAGMTVPDSAAHAHACIYGHAPARGGGDGGVTGVRPCG